MEQLSLLQLVVLLQEAQLRQESQELQPRARLSETTITVSVRKALIQRKPTKRLATHLTSPPPYRLELLELLQPFRSGKPLAQQVPQSELRQKLLEQKPRLMLGWAELNQ